MVRAAALAVLLLTGCSSADGPQEFDDWDVLNEVGSPERLERTTWPVDDRSCIHVNDIQVLGELDAKEFSLIVSEVQRAHPRVTILQVRRAGRYADVLTGINCTSPGSGGGDIYLLRLDGTKWREKGITKWHQ